MPRYSADHFPSYRLHKQSGQAIVTIGGRDHLLGRHGTPASREAYNRYIAAWLASNKSPVAVGVNRDAADSAEAINVEQVIVAFWAHACSYYRRPDGTPSEELNNFKDCLRTLRSLYGKTSAASFGPKCLKACQATLIQNGLARNTINRRIGRIRQVFKWAVAEELVPASVLEGLRSVDGLKRGRSDARETAPVKPVSEDHAHAAIRHASRHDRIAAHHRHAFGRTGHHADGRH